MPEILRSADALVIGGGPAGCAAAIELARAGMRVSLLERKREPHDKVCGEFISWEAAYYLRRLGIDLPALGAEKIHRMRLLDGESLLESALPFPAWSLSRRRLDAALLRQAELAGVDLWRGEKVRELRSSGGNWAVSTTRETWRAGSVFLASGKQDIRDWPRELRGTGDLIGLKLHVRLPRPQSERLRGTVEVFLFDGGYGGLEPVEEGKANLCFLVGKEQYRKCGRDAQAHLAWLAEFSGHLRQRLAGAEALWPAPLAVYRTPYGYLHSPDEEECGLFRLGDQMAVIPSFAGDGIAIALHSAFLAARTCLAGEASSAYHRRARRDFRRPIRTARFIEGLFSRTATRKGAFLLSRLLPGLLQTGIRRTRLGRVQAG